MVANTTASRRRPWPYDAYIGTERVMLVPDDAGQLVGKKSRSLDQTAPVSFEYSSSDPFKERPFEWTKLVAGMGQTTAPTANEPRRRYDHAIRADCSINGQWMKGPDFEDHIETINASAGEVRQLVKALHGGVETVFAVCENGVYRRIADNNWTATLTAGTTPALPGGQFPQQAVRFKNRGTVVTDALYLGTSTGNLWQYNGSVWAQAAAGAGPPDDGTGTGQARYINRIGDELWVAGDYIVTKVEDNPMDRTKYSGAIYIGDRTAKVTWLAVVDNTLVIAKEDGIYTVSAAGVDQELFPTLRGKLSSTNGKNAAVWIDQLWIPFGGKTYRLNASGDLVPDGLEQMLENTSEIRGQMVAGAGHNTWFFYEVYFDGSGHSYLVKHGSWVDDGTGKNVVFLNSAHHGALAVWSKRATSCHIVSGVHSTSNDRLYVEFADGTVEWCVLPANGPSPAGDGNCFIGVTEVDAPSMAGASRRWYEGEVVEITTRDGHKLTGTPNHPILTERGWVALGLLEEGDRVFSRRSCQKMPFTDRDKQHRDFSIEQIFDLSSLTRPVMRRRGVNQQFHGDGQNTDVEIVGSHRLLQDGIEVEFAEPFGHLELSGPNEQPTLLTGAGLSLGSFYRSRLSSKSSISRQSLSTTLLGCLGQRTQGIRFSSSSNRHAPSFKISPDVVRSQIVATTEGLSRLPGEVASDDILSITRKFFTGHVYNLQTSGHWYYANDIIAHNCEFTSLDSYVYLPIHHSNFQADNKLYRAISAPGAYLTNNEWVEVEYRVDIVNSTASWVNVDADNPKFTLPGQRKDFVSDSPVFGRVLQVRIKLTRDPSIVVSPKNKTPIIDGLVIHEQIRPAISLEYTLHVNASTYAARRNGTVVRQRGTVLRDRLLNMVAGAGSVMIQLADGASQDMTLVDYQEGWLPTKKRRDLEYVITLQAIQLQTLTQTPVSSGITYATLERYTWGELEALL